MRQDIAILLPLVSFAVGVYVVVSTFLAGNFIRLAFGVILIVGSLYVFKRNVLMAETELAAKIKRKLNRE